MLATWVPDMGNTQDALYSLANGTQDQTANQTAAPRDDLSMGSAWQDLFTFTADSSGSATITLTKPPGELQTALFAGGVMVVPTSVLKTTGTTYTYTYAYDADGNLTSETDPMGCTTSYTYDAFGDQVSQNRPNGQSTTYAYDLDGNEVSTTDPMWYVTAYAYDAFGNQISQSLPDPANGKQDSGSPTTTYTYDAMGDMLSLTDPVGNTTSWTYDALGDELTQSEPVSLGYASGTTTRQNPITAIYSYKYDLDGNLIESIDADANADGGTNGHVNTYAYNWMNEETSQTWYTDTTDANANTGANSVGTASYGYDLDGRMTSAANTVDNNAVASYSYQYDQVGNVTGQTAQLANVTQVVEETMFRYRFSLPRRTTIMTIGQAWRPTSAVRPILTAPPAPSAASAAESTIF